MNALRLHLQPGETLFHEPSVEAHMKHPKFGWMVGVALWFW